MVTRVLLPYGWRCWVAENLLMGVAPTDIEEQAAAAGVEREAIRAEIEEARNTPCAAAGRWIAQRLKKLESLQQIQVELRRQNSAPSNVPICSELAPDEFRSQFYAQNRPVKLLDMIWHWPALDHWNPEYLRAHYGEAEIEVTSSRDSDPRYEINLERHRRTMMFRDFIHLVCSRSGNDSYLVANNHFFERPGIAALLHDIGELPGYLKQPPSPERTYLWFGPAHTVTPLHHDTMNVLFCQIYGRKRVLLIPPDETPWLYNDIGVYSEVDIGCPDLQRYPLFQHVCPMEVVVHPGEILFLPVGWWHHVRSLEPSISVSFTSFEFPNDYRWQNPDIRRHL